jgi:hypothetical protein
MGKNEYEIRRERIKDKAKRPGIKTKKPGWIVKNTKTPEQLLIEIISGIRESY